ncbi:anti-phage dCTP deaminase [Morganella psychrotolerans]|uniref:anti-phage dCTP deaminase n=1 Tax=Morganella psychrotolerans TaxID=368603 RepID=UPI000AD9D970|nr:anti-phage dCTP deaminase [Morganella psychrotolerans]
MEYNYNGYQDSEIVIGLVGAVGVDLNQVIDNLKDQFNFFSYNIKMIKISEHVISVLSSEFDAPPKRCDRVNYLIEKGNTLREKTKDNAFMAKAVAANISFYRNINKKKAKKDNPLGRVAFIISSLKTPDEVHELRKIYSDGFFLIGVYSSESLRLSELTKKNMTEEEAEELIDRDSDESHKYGQKTRDTYHLSDFFINYDGSPSKLSNDTKRIIDLIFGHPYITPTFDEYAMFMAFSASLRSADLSRQVGAVVTNDNQILSTGANDVPAYGGGLYWPEYNIDNKKIEDYQDGRDYIRGFDSNKNEQTNIIDSIIDDLENDSNIELTSEQLKEIKIRLRKSKIKDITEYGRVVHAEMEAVLSCARNNISTKNATLYCTTFPCHNCAKHIIASGIKRVLYIEPYPKSKALEFHNDSISLIDADKDKKHNKVIFEPFVGVGPKSFFKLFSMNIGIGNIIKRKDHEGKKNRF